MWYNLCNVIYITDCLKFICLYLHQFINSSFVIFIWFHTLYTQLYKTRELYKSTCKLYKRDVKYINYCPLSSPLSSLSQSSSSFSTLSQYIYYLDTICLSSLSALSRSPGVQIHIYTIYIQFISLCSLPSLAYPSSPSPNLARHAPLYNM